MCKFPYSILIVYYSNLILYSLYIIEYQVYCNVQNLHIESPEKYKQQEKHFSRAKLFKFVINFLNIYRILETTPWKSGNKWSWHTNSGCKN